MEFERTALEGVFILKPQIFADERGWFMESYSKRSLAEIGIDCTFVQDNHICSIKRGVLRGIHFQNAPFAQAKLIRCTQGKVMDYAIDLRKSSITYKQFVCVELSAEEKKQFFIPRGFGHAVISLTDYSEIEYRVDNLYNKEYDRTISYCDKELNIPWPMDNIIVSDKDRAAPMLKESDCNF